MKFLKLALVVGLLSLGSTAQAALVARDAGMVYDDVLDVTWAPANLWGQTGTWDQAVAWAAGLSYAGFEDWRLASMSVAAGLPTGATDTVVDCDGAGVTEAQCRDNELGYMYYYNLTPAGDTPPTDVLTDLTGDQGPFTDIQSLYWSGTELASNSNGAWGFYFGNGDPDAFDKGNVNFAAWAVRAGDVAADVAAAPLPGTAVLLALGLLAMGASRQKRRAT